MGNVCCSTLIPENYPPSRRNMRNPTNVEESGLQDSSPRRSTVKKQIHVMSYNILCDYLATPEYGHNVQTADVLSFSFRGPRII